jgi:hypothetical protein
MERFGRRGTRSLTSPNDKRQHSGRSIMKTSTAAGSRKNGSPYPAVGLAATERLRKAQRAA